MINKICTIDEIIIMLNNPSEANIVSTQVNFIFEYVLPK